jgi:hypothetical protein
LVGSASTKINGISTRKLTIAIWIMNDTAVAFPRLVLILFVDSIRLSSNTGPSPFRVQFALGRASAGSGIPDPSTQSHRPDRETKKGN